MTPVVQQYILMVSASLTVPAVIGLLWLFYSFKNHLRNFEEYKNDQNGRLEDKLKIERLTTEKEQFRLKEDYSEKISKIATENHSLSITMSNYMKRSVEVDEEQTQSIKDLQKLIIDKLLNGTKEKT